MSSSQFDDLLGDFGGESATTTTTTTTKSSSGFDDFDPFGPSSTTVTTTTNGGSGGGSGMLLDFSVGAEVKNGEASLTTNQSANPLYDEFTNDTTTTEPVNPLYDFADESIKTSSEPANPLYDEFASQPASTEPANPLFDEFTSQPASTEPANPLYEELTTQSATLDSANPLYDDFSAQPASTGQVNPFYDELQTQQESEPAQTEAMEPQEEGIAELHIDEMAPQVMNGNARDWFGEHFDEHVVEEQQKEEQEEEEEKRVDDAARDSQGVASFSEAGLVNKDAEVHTSNTRETKQNAEIVTERTTVTSTSSSRMEEERHNQDAVADDEEEEGVYENEPERRDDVAREADKDVSVGLPAVGTASSMRARFLQDAEEKVSAPRAKREITPPAHGAGGEYVSEPRTVMESYEAKPDAGVFESPEPTRNPDVISAYDLAEEARPEQGTARNLAARFKDLESQNSSPAAPKRREITPPRTAAEAGQSEYVSEPRGPGVEQYEAKVDAGVFESEPQVNTDVVHSGEAQEEALPERGTAKNLASRYLQMSEESKSPPSARPQREIQVTADPAARVEYESEPQRNPDVITSDTQVEEFIPQRGFAKNIASRFKELESSAKSPPQSPGRHKEFTPPRDDGPVVRESAPSEENPDIVHSGDLVEEALPEKGTARNMMQRFKQLESQNRSPGGTTRAKKEFTPPPGDAGVYENTPKTFQADYNRPAESGIVENQPVQRDDVVRGTEPPKYEEELPERGAAKNLVSKWRQMESESAKAKSPGSRPKEFTPPREEPRLASRKSPRTPLSPGADSSMDNGSVHPSELPGQYQPQQGESVFESTPEERADVLREGERDYAADLPRKNTAKKMLARFQSFQEKAKEGGSDAGSPRQDSESSTEPEQEPAMESARLKFEDPAQIGRSKSMRAAIQLEKCAACGKTVYAMERLEINNAVYHKACFRCSVCKAVLTAKTFAINNGVIYCTTHYKQLFATKGNYDEGFGRMQHKKRWNSNPNLNEDDSNTAATSNSSQNGHHIQQQQQQHSVAAANS